MEETLDELSPWDSSLPKLDNPPLLSQRIDVSMHQHNLQITLPTTLPMKTPDITIRNISIENNIFIL